MATKTRTPPMLTVKQLIPPMRPRQRYWYPAHGAAQRVPNAPDAGGCAGRLGKDQLLSAWARDVDKKLRVAWVSLDEGDDDPGRFWRYVLTALIRVSSATVDDRVPVPRT